MSKPEKSAWMRAVKISGILVILPPLVGLLPGVIGMMRTFYAISTDRPPAPQTADYIHLAMRTTEIGLVVSAIACIALIVSVIGLRLERRRARTLAPQNRTQG